MCAQHPARERANDVAREGATAEVQDQITSDSAQELERDAETSEAATDRWIPTGAVSSVGGHRHRTVATSTACLKKMLTKGPEGPATDEGDQRDRRLKKGTRGTGDCDGCADEGDRTAGSRY